MTYLFNNLFAIICLESNGFGLLRRKAIDAAIDAQADACVVVDLFESDF